MAAPVVSSSSTLALATRTTSDVPVPTGVAAGDFILVHFYIETTRVAITPPAGFTEVTFTTTPSAGGLHHRQFWKIATAADVGNYSFTHSSIGTRGWAYRLTNASGFASATSAVSTASSTATPAVSLTTTGPERLLMHFVSGGSTSYTPASGFTELFDTLGHLVETKVQTAEGSTGSVSAAGASNSTNTVSVMTAIVGTTIASDDFVGTNGTSLSSTKYTLGGGGTATIQNNKARLAGNAASQYGVSRALLVMNNQADSDLLVTGVDFTTGVASEQYLFLYLRHNGSWAANNYDPQTGYCIRFMPGASFQDADIRRFSGGTGITLWQSPIEGEFVFSGLHDIRVRIVGGVIRFRIWPTGGTEPSGWHAMATDATPLAAGRMGWAAVNGPNTTIRPVDVESMTASVGAAYTVPTVPTVPNTLSAVGYYRTTAQGTDVFQYEIRPDGVTTGNAGQAYLYLPSNKPTGSTIKACIASHGFNNSPSNFLDVLGNGGARVLTDRLLDAGYVVIVPNYDNTFGNSDAMGRMTRARNYLYANWTVSGTVLLGFSMGGGASLIAAHRKPFSDIRAVQAVASAIDLVRLGGTGSTYDVASAIQAAYSTTAAGVQAATAAYDPAQQPGSAFTGQRIRIVTSSADDYVLRPDSLTFLSKISPYATQAIDVDSSIAEHGDYGQWANPDATVAFFDFAIANPVALGRALDVWNGATLVRRRVDVWNGTALVQRRIDP